MADIEVVQPVEDAPRVVFDYTAAGTAIDAIAAMRRKVTGQTDTRVDAQTDVVVNWTGTFRTEFDGAVRLLNGRFTDLLESAGALSGKIHGAVDDANEKQREYNRAAQNKPPAPVGRPVP